MSDFARDTNVPTNDLISRQDVIRWVKIECNPYGNPTLDYESGIKVIKYLERMPSEQLEEIALHESCTDCPLYDNDRHSCPRFNKVIPETLRELQSAPTERKKGKWIKQNPFVDTEECSLCKYNIYSEELETPFCPWCGAEMETNYGETN